jgi:hypothetical protein
VPLLLFQRRFSEEIRLVREALQQRSRDAKEKHSSDIAEGRFARAMRCARLLLDRNLTIDEMCARSGLDRQGVQDLDHKLLAALSPAAGEPDAATEMISPSNVKLSHRNHTVLTDLTSRLTTAHLASPRLVERALAKFPLSEWPSYECCIFRGLRFAGQAKAYLAFLQRLQIPDKQIRIILFCATDSKVATQWLSNLGCGEAIITYRRPPNAKSDATQKWVGIQPLFPQPGAHGVTRLKAASGYGAAIRFASSVVASIDRDGMPNTEESKGVDGLDDGAGAHD